MKGKGKNMDQTTINQKLLGEAIDLYFKKSKPTMAIECLDRILDTDKNSLIYSFKARILKDTGKGEKALKVIDEGLEYKRGRVHYLRARVIVQKDFKKPLHSGWPMLQC